MHIDIVHHIASVFFMDQNTSVEIYPCSFLTSDVQYYNGQTKIKISVKEVFKLWFN